MTLLPDSCKFLQVDMKMMGGNGLEPMTFCIQDRWSRGQNLPKCHLGNQGTLIWILQRISFAEALFREPLAFVCSVGAVQLTCVNQDQDS